MHSVVGRHNNIMAVQIMESCQICLNDMTASDELFPLHCPTPKCHFNLCLECIINMLLSEADGYQLASDGSNQLKFRVRCPNCCGRYKLPRRPKQSIVPLVATLRQAYEVQDLLPEMDAHLPRAAARQKATFIRNTALAELREALEIYEDYCELHDKPALGSLDLRTFSCLPRLQVTWCDPSLFAEDHVKLLSHSEQELLTQLFCSGDANKVAEGVLCLQSMTANRADFRTIPEIPPEDSAFTESTAGSSTPMIEPHDFIMELFCGVGTVEQTSTNIVSPLSSMSPVNTMATRSEDTSETLQQRDLFGQRSSPLFGQRSPTSSDVLLNRMFGVDGTAPPESQAAASVRSMRTRTSSRLRGLAPFHVPPVAATKLPLPSRMPKGALLPVYHPLGWYTLIKFDKAPDSLVMQAFGGPAKQSGFCQRDILTHTPDGPVHRRQDYHTLLESLYLKNSRSTMTLVVNADQDTADHLKTRSLLMRLLLKR